MIIRFLNVFNDIDNFAKFQMINGKMLFEYSIDDMEFLESLRDNLNKVIEEMKEIEQLDEKERMKKWVNKK